MLNAPVGVQRVMGRLRRPTSHDPAITARPQRTAAARRLSPSFAHPVSVARRRGALALSLPTPSVRDVMHRLGHERTVALSVAGIVLAASFLSVAPGGAPSGDTGGPSGDGAAPRLAVGGDGSSDETTGTVEEAYAEESDAAEAYLGAGDDVYTGDVEAVTAPEDPVAEVAAVADPAAVPDRLARIADIDSQDPEAQAVIAEREAASTAVEGPFLDDGTLLKPVAVDTTVADGSDLVRTYKVKSGDTLVEIAKAHGVSMMTLWWANKLKSKDDLRRGQVLRIPPVNGLVVTVKAGDTLAALAKEHKVTEAKVVETNGLTDTNLVVGQVLVLPGAKGDPIPTPKPKPTKKPSVSRSSSGGSGGGSARPPKTYSGGRFAWPAPGARVSQYFRYGHYALDLDGDTGDRIVAAASGTVVFAGWKSNGGGYQVWIAHGSGLYTTYNHMSSVAVGKGQRVAKGQRIGRMGATGFVTGSHLHFEVWKGQIWNGGRRVNPLGYY